MNITLTDEQEILLKEAIKWFNGSSEQVFQYTAPAGGGKSLMMHLIIDRLRLSVEQVAPMAYTGAAAIIMKKNGFITARTAHSWLYKYIEYMEEDPVTHYKKRKRKFVPTRDYLIGVKLICIDEAGMIPMKMKKIILNHGIKVLVCGDLNQLPPVKDTPAFLYDGKIFRLTKIMRQAQNSAIIYLSQLLLKGIKLKPGRYNEVDVITRKQLNDHIIKNADIIICGTNKSRDAYNKKVRLLRGYKELSLPADGEKVICRQNNWTTSIDGICLANGLVGRVFRTPSIAKLNIRENKFVMNFIPDMFSELLFEDLVCDYQYFNADYVTRNDIRAGRIKVPQLHDYKEKFELAYAITTHLSQGSQYMSGIYMEEYVSPSIQNRLNYTGITRFRNHCIYVLPYEKDVVLRKHVMLFDGYPSAYYNDIK